MIQTIADRGRAPHRVRPHPAVRAADEEPDTTAPRSRPRTRSRFDELKATIPHTFSGFEYDSAHAWADCTPEQRLEVLEEIYEDGSLKLWLAGFGEMFFSPEVSEEISEFVREQDARPA